MASVSATGWVSNPFTCSPLTTGDKANVNNNCGPNTVKDDHIWSGTPGSGLPCISITQMATTANPWWVGLLAQQGATTASPGYKFVFDGGTQFPDQGAFILYDIAAIRLLVDPTYALGLEIVMYGLNNVERMSGVTFLYNEGSGYQDAAGVQNLVDVAGLGLLKNVGDPYWIAAEKTVYLNKVHNDLDDPNAATCSKAKPDMTDPTTHNWVLASGNVAAGTNDATHVTLASSADCKTGSIVQMLNGNNGGVGNSGSTYGLVTGCASAVATVAGGWTVAGVAPTRKNIISATYTSGITAVGTTGQTCQITISGGTGNAQALVSLDATNHIASGTALTSFYYPGDGFNSAPTSGSTSTGYPGNAASCSGTATISTVVGTAYTIFDTFTLADTTGGNTTVATFANTAALAGTISVGDGLFGYNGWGQFFHPAGWFSMVTLVGSGTCNRTTGGNVSLSANQACVINSTAPTAGTTTGTQAWRMIKWSTGDCGLWWQNKHIAGNVNLGATPAVYPTWPYPGLVGPSSNIVSESTNMGVGDPSVMMLVDLANIEDDTRAGRDLTRNQSWLFDYWQRHYADYWGWTDIGPAYSYDGQIAQTESQAFLMSNSVAGFSNFTFQSHAQQLMFNAYPDRLANGIGFQGFAANPDYGYGLNSPVAALVIDPSFYSAPQSSSAGFLQNWMRVGSPTNYWGGGSPTANFPLTFLHTDPRIANIDYTTQPLQYAFGPYNGAANCASLSGWPCGEFRGDYMSSRTSWTDLAATDLSYDTRTYAQGSYDVPSGGNLCIYKASWLLCNDNYSIGAHGDNTNSGDALNFGGYHSNNWQTSFNANPFGGNKENITAWAASNAGTLGAAYGDKNSAYAYVCSNTALAYNTSLVNVAYSNRCVLDSKKPGKDQFIFQMDDFSATAAGGGGISAATHLHYNQNGQPIALPGGTTATTGTTICVNSSGTQVNCSTLNTNRIIKEVEGGSTANTGVGTPPTQNYGLLTYIASPGTINVTWDSPGAGLAPQASPGNTYTGGSGLSDRVTINAGASPGTAVTGGTWCIVHKIMQNLSDTTFVAAGFQPDANWYGCNAEGATSGAVFVQALNNTTQASITGFNVTTSKAFTAYTIAGLTPGTYTPRINGTSVGTCNGMAVPCTVSAGDNSLYFESTTTGSLTVSLNVAPVSGSAMGGNAIIGGKAVIH